MSHSLRGDIFSIQPGRGLTSAVFVCVSVSVRLCLCVLEQAGCRYLSLPVVHRICTCLSNRKPALIGSLHMSIWHPLHHAHLFVIFSIACCGTRPAIDFSSPPLLCVTGWTHAASTPLSCWTAPRGQASIWHGSSSGDERPPTAAVCQRDRLCGIVTSCRSRNTPGRSHCNPGRLGTEANAAGQALWQQYFLPFEFAPGRLDPTPVCFVP